MRYTTIIIIMALVLFAVSIRLIQAGLELKECNYHACVEAYGNDAIQDCYDKHF